MCSRSADAGFDHHRCSAREPRRPGWRNWTLPTPPAAGPAALANQAVVTRNEPHPLAEQELLPPGASIVVLAGRATHVP